MINDFQKMEFLYFLTKELIARGQTHAIIYADLHNAMVPMAESE